jgi:hypothetical protein
MVVEGEPQVPHSAATLLNDLLEIRGDCVGDLRKDNGVHSSPRRIIRECIIRLDVVGEGVSCQGHQHEVMPEGIVRGCAVEDDVHQLVNVWNCRSIEVEVDDDGRVR